MAVNEHDRAVVIGISRYADAGSDAGWITDLNASDTDAAAVAEWLRRDDESGGRLSYDNVRLVRSADFPDPANLGPQQQAVVTALAELTSLPRNAYGQFAGRRLYVYVGGHGVASRRDEAALITAEASQADPLNVLVTSWVDWLWEASVFQEYVLWVDTCATRVTPPIVLHSCDLPPERHPEPTRGRLFWMFAAGLNQTAVEAEIEGEWHGVFTYALLKGLNGASGAPVTTQNLKTYMINSMKTFMTDNQRNDPVVAKEPWFGPEADMEFAVPAAPQAFSVTLRFPQDCVGKRVTISVTKDSPLVDETVLQQAEWEVSLGVGAYVLFVSDLDRQHAFEVTKGGADAVVTVP
jgi:uncharacterized caspase-like protein